MADTAVSGRAQKSAADKKGDLQRLLLYFAISLLSQLFFILLVSSSLQDYRQGAQENLISAGTSMTAGKLTVVAQLGRRVENYRLASQDLYDLRVVTGSPDAFITDDTGNIILGSSIYGLDSLDLDALSALGTFAFNNLTYVIKPYYDNRAQIQGYVAACADVQEKGGYNLPFSFYVWCAAAALCSLMLLKLGMALGGRLHTSEGRRRLLSLTLPFLFGQLLTAGAAAGQYLNIAAVFAQDLEKNVAMALSLNFREIRAHNINLEDISGYERYFDAIKAEIDTVGAISVFSSKGELTAGDNQPLTSHAMPIFSSGSMLGSIEVSAAPAFLRSLGLDMLLKLLTLLVVSAVLSHELGSLAFLEFRRHEQKQNKIPFEPDLIRPLSFLYVFALFLPITIVPVRMVQYREDFPFLPVELVQSLPVCTEMLCVTISSFYILLTRGYRGRWQILGRNALMLLCLQAFVAALCPNGYFYLISRALYGLGYGALLGCCQLYVIDCSSKENRGTNMNLLSAGLYSGVLCSAAAGGIIADTLGYRAVFLVSCTLFALCFAIFTYANSRRYLPTCDKMDESGSSRLDLGAIKTLLSNRRILCTLLFLALPYSIIGVGFFNYLLPISFNSHNLGAALLGQFNFIYAFIIIAVAPLTGRLIDKLQEKTWILLAVSMCASAVVPVMFNLPYFLAAVFVVMVMLGLSASVNEGGQLAFVSCLASKINPQDPTLPQSSVLLLDSVLRIGQTCAPLLIGLMLATGSTESFFVLTGAAVLCVSIFALMQLRRNKQSPVAA